MTDWLSEIEEDPWSTRKTLHMARVLRELAGFIETYFHEGEVEDILSDDAKELCVAARDR